MSGLITRFPNALSASGLILPVSRFAPSAESQAFYSDPAVKEAWDVRIDFGRKWVGRKAGTVATLLTPTSLPKVRKTPGGQSQALFGLSNANPLVFSTPQAAALWPIAGDYTLIMYGQGDPLYPTLGAFFSNGRTDDYTSDGGSTGQTGGGYFGYSTTQGNIVAIHQTRNPAPNPGTAAGVGAPLIQSTPNLYPTGLHWYALSYREATKTMRELVDGVAIKTTTGITKGNLSSLLQIGGTIMDGSAVQRPLRGFNVMNASVSWAAMGETDQAPLLAKATAYYEARRLRG